MSTVDYVKIGVLLFVCLFIVYSIGWRKGFSAGINIWKPAFFDLKDINAELLERINDK